MGPRAQAHPPTRLVARPRLGGVGSAGHRSPAQGASRSPYRAVLASDATPRCASMASADRQMIGDATLGWAATAHTGCAGTARRRAQASADADSCQDGLPILV